MAAPPPVRRVITTHTESGVATVKEAADLPLKPAAGFNGVETASVWVTHAVPSKDNGEGSDGSARVPGGDLGIVQRDGAHCMMTALEPGGSVVVHRTSSLDLNILISGKLIVVMEDGSEELVEEPGSVVVQRGTLHSWRNPGTEWTRWMCVLIDAEPVVVDGKALPAEART